MENVTVVHEKDRKRLTITIDLSLGGSPSASGKTLVIASTKGNKEVAPGVYLGLNLYRYAKPKA